MNIQDKTYIGILEGEGGAYAYILEDKKYYYTASHWNGGLNIDKKYLKNEFDPSETLQEILNELNEIKI